MSKKEPSNAQILDILDTHSTVLGNHTQMIETNRKAIEANGKSIGNIKEQVALIHIKLAEHDRRFEVLEERTAYLPKLYEAVDAFMVEIQENRQERALMFNTLKNHEVRIAHLEHGCESLC